MCLKDADLFPNSEDPDQMAQQNSLIWVYTVCPKTEGHYV